MKTKLAIALGVTVALALAYAAGRYQAPTKVEYQEKIVKVETVKVVEVKVRGEETTKVVYRTRTKAPDGTVTETETERTDTKTKETTSGATDTTRKVDTDTRKTQTTTRPDYRIAALVGAPLRLDVAPSLVYGFHAERRLLGPVSAGVWVLRDSKTSGVMVGLGVSVEF